MIVLKILLTLRINQITLLHINGAIILYKTDFTTFSIKKFR